ncbi:MAG TPA: hypothetical protein VF817_05015 [Patescibacteria group bacterium]
MYIKIKTLKYFLFILSIFVLSSLNYFKYIEADDTQTNAGSTQTSSESSATYSLAQDFQAYLSSKDGQSVSTSDVSDFINSEISDKVGDPITLDTLPQIDASKIKVLNQPYASLPENERKQKELDDAYKYVATMAYLLASNSPMPITGPDDFASFRNDFLNHFATLETSNPDLQYFSDLGDRLGLFLDQVNNVEVPETMVDIHIKFLRIANGLLALKKDASISNVNDPISRMVLIKKTDAYINLVTGLISTDLANYFKNLNA